MKLNKYNSILFLFFATSLLPVLRIGGYGFPASYLIAFPAGVYVLYMMLFCSADTPNVAKFILIFFTLIILSILVSTYYGTTTRLNEFVFPIDILQYIVRFSVFSAFLMASYKGKLETDIFLKYFLVFMTATMLVGILQWFPWPGRYYFIELYPFRDGSFQIARADKDMHLFRISGFAQHHTSNGGLAAFAFAVGFSVFNYAKKHLFLSCTLMLLSILNIIASQARGGFLAFSVSLVLFYLVSTKISRKSLAPTLIAIPVLAMLTYTINYLSIRGNVFINQMIFRWNMLFITEGGGRINQMNYFLSYINRLPDYIFGLSKPFVNQSAISYGVEIEPFNIFILYGIISFFLHYSLVLYLLYYFFKRLKKSSNKQILSLLVASFVGFFSYQIFSLGYFFFREISVGLIPWMLIGGTIGLYERNLNIRNNN